MAAMWQERLQVEAEKQKADKEKDKANDTAKDGSIKKNAAQQTGDAGIDKTVVNKCAPEKHKLANPSKINAKETAAEKGKEESSLVDGPEIQAIMEEPNDFFH